MTKFNYPTVISEEFSRYFSISKQELLTESGKDGLMLQCGAAYIDVDIPLPNFPIDHSINLAMIETFQVNEDGLCQVLGSKHEWVDAFIPCAEIMAKAVITSLNSFDVEIVYPAYLTASVTQCSEIIGNAHFDDEHYNASDGVGFVAIVGDRGGSRIAREPISFTPIYDDDVPVIFDQQGVDDFDRGELLINEAEPEKLVIFPQFGQLHAGPPLATAGISGVRRLMVMRAKTKVKNPEMTSLKTRKRRQRRRS